MNMDNTGNQIQYHLCEYLFSNDISKNAKLNNIFSLMEKGGVSIPDSLIISNVYSLNTEEIDTVTSDIREKIESNVDPDKVKRKYKKDILSDIQVAILQRKYIKKSINGSKESIGNIEQDIKQGIYSNFIEIMSVFTAITFATFGGLNLLGSLFKSPKAINSLLVGYRIILSSIYLFSIYLILLALIAGLSRLIQVNKISLRSKSSKYFIIAFGCIFVLGVIFVAIGHLKFHE